MLYLQYRNNGEHQNETWEHNTPAKLLKSNTGGVSFCSIGIQYAMPYSQKYTPPHCLFCKFAGWEVCYTNNKGVQRVMFPL